MQECAELDYAQMIKVRRTSLGLCCPLKLLQLLGQRKLPTCLSVLSDGPCFP